MKTLLAQISHKRSITSIRSKKSAPYACFVKGNSVELLNQPFTGQLGERLIELLDSTDYHTLNFVVAFAKNSGVLRIKDALERFRGRGGKVNAYVGIDLGGTSYEALNALLLYTDSLNIVHSENGQTFHAKMYHFLGKGKGLLVAGSHNLTGGGLWTNFESSLLIPLGEKSLNEVELEKRFSDYIDKLVSLEKSFMPVGAQADVEKLLESGYILKEVTEKLYSAKARKRDGGKERLFGNGVPAKLPRINTPKEVKEAAAPWHGSEAITVTQSDEGETIWFETRRMTGGSRNILDLSMKSLIERGDPAGTSFALEDRKFMRGGVEFFGINPVDVDQIKNITINFEGVDYKGNTVLFPVGENANGTWRLQIKGVASSEEKITEAFKRKGEDYLVKKIITFTKIQDDYYFLSVFPDSELETFKAASRILARNGGTANAKLLGLL